MSAEKLNVDKRISMTKIKYVFLEYDECGQPDQEGWALDLTSLAFSHSLMNCIEMERFL